MLGAFLVHEGFKHTAPSCFFEGKVRTLKTHLEHTATEKPEDLFERLCARFRRFPRF